MLSRHMSGLGRSIHGLRGATNATGEETDGLRACFAALQAELGGLTLKTRSVRGHVTDVGLADTAGAPAACGAVLPTGERTTTATRELTSGRPDLNRGPHRPERCALPGCATPRRYPVSHRHRSRRASPAREEAGGQLSGRERLGPRPSGPGGRRP